MPGVNKLTTMMLPSGLATVKHRLLLLAFSSVASCACTGFVAGDGSTTDTDAVPAPASTGPGLGSGAVASGNGTPAAPGAETSVTEQDRSKACNAAMPGPSNVRRLSHVEYRKTLQAVFPTLDLPEIELPKDVAVRGLENNARSLNPSQLLIEGYRDYARAVAEQAARELYSVDNCQVAADEQACARSYLEQLGASAFRRPLAADELARYQAFFSQRSAELGFESAISLTLQALLQAPQFLYRLELGAPADPSGSAAPLTAFEQASRLSYFLWQTPPDGELLRAASSGELATNEQILAQANRMLADPRATSTVVDFHRQWLGFDEVLEQEKEPTLYPEWSPSLRAAIREESDRFVAAWFESGSATLGELLTSRTSFVNPELAAFYGVEAQQSAWHEVVLPAERAGVLTRAAFLAGRAHSTNGSPPLRGVAVLDRLLCVSLGAPPAIANLDEPLNTDNFGKTNRQVFEERTAPNLCRGCHMRIDGIGFGFEAFDAMGKYRTLDNGQPVDASGALVGTDVDGSYSGAVELSQRLAGSQQVLACAADHWFRYAFGRAAEPDEWCKVDSITQALAQSGGDIRSALLSIVTAPEFRQRRVVP